MKTRTVTIAGLGFEVPYYYQQAESIPEDPPESVSLIAQTDYSACFSMAYPITDQQRMPYDQLAVIEGMRGAMAYDQGLIEVEANAEAGPPYVYSIVKCMKEDAGRPAGVQYVLTLDVGVGEGAVRFQGFFDESGNTGVRDALVYSMLRGNGEVGAGMEGWVCDPYDANWKRGALMNLSEQHRFDDMFPAHPLSMARSFVDCVLGY